MLTSLDSLEKENLKRELVDSNSEARNVETYTKPLSAAPVIQIPTDSGVWINKFFGASAIGMLDVLSRLLLDKLVETLEGSAADLVLSRLDVVL